MWSLHNFTSSTLWLSTSPRTPTPPYSIQFPFVHFIIQQLHGHAWFGVNLKRSSKNEDSLSFPFSSFWWPPPPIGEEWDNRVASVLWSSALRASKQSRMKIDLVAIDHGQELDNHPSSVPQQKPGISESYMASGRGVTEPRRLSPRDRAINKPSTSHERCFLYGIWNALALFITSKRYSVAIAHRENNGSVSRSE